MQTDPRPGDAPAPVSTTSDATPTVEIVQPRSWVDRTKDEVSAWFGDVGALARRQQDETAGDHSGEGPQPLLTGDERILDEVSRRLIGDAQLNASRIKVQVLAGGVTLAGSVLTQADKHRAEDLAGGVTGVSAVQNHLAVE
jgi:osmotically-inducible protein OsmY